MVEARRYGRFAAPARLAHDFNTDLKRVMGQCIVFRAEHLFSSDDIEYWAASEHFRQVAPGEVVPEYRWMISDIDGIWAEEVTSRGLTTIERGDLRVASTAMRSLSGGHYDTDRVCATLDKLAADGVAACGATEQALGLYAAQVEAIRELLDKHAPNTTGNVQTRLGQVFAAFDDSQHQHDAGMSAVARGRKELIDAMVDRFLGWKLPANFGPDAGIGFHPYMPHQTPESHLWPVGTNLFTADQARAMFEYALGVKGLDQC